MTPTPDRENALRLLNEELVAAGGAAIDDETFGKLLDDIAFQGIPMTPTPSEATPEERPDECLPDA